MRTNHNPVFPQSQPHGFVLVVTVSLMILLTVVAIGLLGLSSIALRTGSRELARVEAQTNARLALALAIGELQTQLGPDQRVSASGAIVPPPASVIRT
jgi:Tfp pilus assembly protein PilX